MVFHWSLSDSKSPQVSRTFSSILADLNNAVVWIFSGSSSDFQLYQTSYQDLGDRPKRTSYNWYQSHLHVL